MNGIGRAAGSIVDTVDDDSTRWVIPRPVAWTLLVAPLPLMAAMAAIGGLESGLYHALIDEDGPIELGQVVLMGGAAVAFGVAAVRARAAGRRGLAAIYLLVAVGAFVATGEEISWGQRILGFTTPEPLEPVNQQGESNLHNIVGVQRLFNLGEMLAGLYGLAIPIVWQARSVRTRLGRWLDSLLVPPLCLTALFFLPFAYRAVRFTLLPHAGERTVELGEVAELAFYVGVLVMGVVTARALRPTTPTRA